jgi:hypothetical protein
VHDLQVIFIFFIFSIFNDAVNNSRLYIVEWFDDSKY